ncbi:peptidoglycan glycosyltransferase [Stella humosa]|uniref:Peptidoglycan glycosyltransferase n=1 Tax=Stella humosa TaxID=94 RepID=A0A3N1LCG0_9PROT|nr:penicillin-binding protein 2 [Stella humosa]ROP90721.1 peptidoglycan glycosyltransferase [Stella humosa]BBK29379.1 peptidoglycan glycosyltransferase [Stella humosa]
MRQQRTQARTFTRRALLLGGGQAVLFAALGARLYYLQVVEAGRYTMLADENRINLRLLPPPRGRVVDRYGEPLAVNGENYRLVLIPEQVGDLEKALDIIDRIAPLGEVDRRRVLREARRKRGFVPILVRGNLTWDEVARIEVNANDLPGVAIDLGLTRQYPQGAVMGHVVGYVSAVAEHELTGDPVLELPDFRIGKNGVERHREMALRGTAGASEVEVNAYGRIIRELGRQEGRPGEEVVLTVDLGLQRYVDQRLAQEESAAAVVMDVHTGEVVALVSSPGFDPNLFANGISTQQWNDLRQNPRGPLANKAVAGQYAPGSTFKMVVAVAGLETRAITTDQRIHCPGHFELGEQRFHCWKRSGHGPMNMHEAMKQSCDVYFYELARRVGIDRLAPMCRRFGLGESSEIGLPGERSGLIPSREWKQAARKASWVHGDTILTGIGQGFVLTTPLQLAVMTARLVNGGRAVMPRLTRAAVMRENQPAVRRDLFPSLGISAHALAAVRDGMSAVVNEQGGTAYAIRVRDPDMAIGGKTGTAQVRRITMAERERGVRRNDELAWRERDHALFVGYGPVEAPRYAVSVVVEHGGGGSSIAGPIARDILVETMRRDPARMVPPSRIMAGRPDGRS